MDKDKAPRPPWLRVDVQAIAEEVDAMERETSLLPGMVRTPSRLFGGGPGVDWAAPGSTVWEEGEEQPPGPQTLRTPLTGYGANGDTWVSATASTLLGEDASAAAAAAAAFDVPPTETQEQTLADPALPSPATLGARGLPGTLAGPHPGVFSTSAMEAVARGTGTHRPYTVQPNLFTVQDGTTVSGPTGGAGLTVTEHHGHPHHQHHHHNHHHHSNHNNTSGGGGRSAGGTSALPTLEDKHVAQSIIVSAGLPLSVSSLVAYIREGQPHFDERRTPGTDALIVGTTGPHRNYPNLSEPPPVQGARYGHGAPTGSLDGMGYPSPPQQPQPSARMEAEMGWTGMPESSTTGGWNVQANSSSHSPAPPPVMVGGPGAERAPRGYTSGGRGGYGVGGGGGYRGGSGGPHLSGFGQPPSTAPGDVMYGGTVQAHGGPRVGGGQPQVYGGPHGSARPKSESEILSDLLHFHANFFPPPPPPRVPSAHKRSRAALWYHYASKWDITHRLPPPPRTPLPEMELEYLRNLPELTRVPYHGDGWLAMSERWFAVTQSLFDFPEENVGMESYAAVVMEKAVTS